MANIIPIDSLSAPGLEVFSRLTEAQLRNRLEPSKGIFIAESPKVIATALHAGYEPLSLLTTRKHIEGQAAALLEQLPDLPVYTAEEELLTQLTGFQITRGILCAMRRKPLPAPETVCRTAHRLAVLEGIVDATNIGAIFRSATALGMDGILVTPSCCDPLYRRAARVSMGTVFQIPWARLDQWPAGGLQMLREQGFVTAAMTLKSDSLSLDDPRLTDIDKLAVVLGAEGDGLTQDTIARCDYTVKIPMFHGVDSLNVAAASAVAFWQFRKRGYTI